MYTVYYASYSKVLDKWFENVKEVRTLEDFHLYAQALHSANYDIKRITFK